jgi:hypothetical protein
MVMVWVLLLVLVAVALGILGTVIKGLLYLLGIGIAVFVLALVIGALTARHRNRRPTR